MGVNFGEGDSLAAASRLNLIARYLAPMPGRKNLVWFAAEFPLSLFPSRDQTDAYREEVKKTLDLLAANQIAVYPVDASGVPSTESYAPPGDVAAPASPLMLARMVSAPQRSIRRWPQESPPVITAPRCSPPATSLRTRLRG